MVSFFKFSAMYLVAAIVIVFVTRDMPGDVLVMAWTQAVSQAPVITQFVGGILGASLVIGLVKNQNSGRKVIIAVVFALVATLFFHSAFTLTKTSLPYIRPFWADPMFADVDKALHFGVDPWQMAHWLAGYLPIKRLLPLYYEIWMVPAICLPAFLAAFDKDPARVRRFLILYACSWVFVGHVFALAGMSAGPVYYDRLLGGDRFADLMATLQSSALNGTRLMRIQDSLWRIYAENGQSFGSGISAFPSVHVAVAMVTGLYLYERSSWLAPLGVFFTVGVLFLSVYTGYHYAIDGYFSILFVWLLWGWLVKRAERPDAALSVA